MVTTADEQNATPGDVAPKQSWLRIAAAVCGELLLCAMIAPSWKHAVLGIFVVAALMLLVEAVRSPFRRLRRQPQAEH